MKNQNDLIWSIVSLVLALIVFGVCWGTMKTPQPITPPPTVNVSTPAYPSSTVVMDTKLPNAADNQNGGGGGGSRTQGPSGNGGNNGDAPTNPGLKTINPGGL